MPILIEALDHVYQVGTARPVQALSGIDLTIADGEILGIIGPTGSGKSTLVQHLNGLLRPTRGRVLVDGVDLSDRKADLRAVRQKVGLVFQYPEHQLFEETVAEDVAFGPRNLGLSEGALRERVARALRTVGLPAEIGARSPFALSGGQMRRVALAGVLAMEPAVLVLDEPAAGLDPQGRRDILGHVRRLHQERRITVILVSHSMEEVARLCERLVVLDGGRVVMDGRTRDIFAQGDRLRQVGLGPPAITRLMEELRRRGKDVRADAVTVDEAAAEILRHWRGRACAHA
ncbi:MAG: energy-coupling factor transporter ATPase [bacterium]|nr:energy-coupling factor transporter ATPase [bacterium]